MSTYKTNPLNALILVIVSLVIASLACEQLGPSVDQPETLSPPVMSSDPTEDIRTVGYNLYQAIQNKDATAITTMMDAEMVAQNYSSCQTIGSWLANLQWELGPITQGEIPIEMLRQSKAMQANNITRAMTASMEIVARLPGGVWKNATYSVKYINRGSGWTIHGWEIELEEYDGKRCGEMGFSWEP